MVRQPSGRGDSNPRPPVPQTGALPSCATTRWRQCRPSSGESLPAGPGPPRRTRLPWSTGPHPADFLSRLPAEGQHRPLLAGDSGSRRPDAEPGSFRRPTPGRGQFTGAEGASTGQAKVRPILVRTHGMAYPDVSAEEGEQEPAYVAYDLPILFDQHAERCERRVRPCALHWQVRVANVIPTTAATHAQLTPVAPVPLARSGSRRPAGVIASSTAESGGFPLRRCPLRVSGVGTAALAAGLHRSRAVSFTATHSPKHASPHHMARTCPASRIIIFIVSVPGLWGSIGRRQCQHSTAIPPTRTTSPIAPVASQLGPGGGSPCATPARPGHPLATSIHTRGTLWFGTGRPSAAGTPPLSTTHPAGGAGTHRDCCRKWRRYSPRRLPPSFRGLACRPLARPFSGTPAVGLPHPTCKSEWRWIGARNMPHPL